MDTAIKHPVPDRIKPSFVIFDIRALWRSALNVERQFENVMCCTTKDGKRLIVAMLISQGLTRVRVLKLHCSMLANR